MAEGAPVHDAGGDVRSMEEVVQAIERVVPDAEVSFEAAPFSPTPPSFDGAALAEALGPVEWRPLDAAVRDTVERFRALAERGVVSAELVRA